MKASIWIIIPVVIAILGTAASLYHSDFFYTADGYMSPKTAVQLGLMEDNEALFTGGLSFRKREYGGYDYREGRAISFVGRTLHTDIDLAEECERLGGCEWRR